MVSPSVPRKVFSASRSRLRSEDSSDLTPSASPSNRAWNAPRALGSVMLSVDDCWIV
jgi:hypothetical protein